MSSVTRASNEREDQPMSGSAALPPFELGTPGPMRDRLVAAVLAGQKTATSGLRLAYDLDAEPIPREGERFALLDSTGARVGVVRITGVGILPLGDVGDRVAHAEGEGFADRHEWRAAHEEFWATHVDVIREFLGVESWTIGDDTRVVVEHFVLER